MSSRVGTRRSAPTRQLDYGRRKLLVSFSVVRSFNTSSSVRLWPQGENRSSYPSTSRTAKSLRSPNSLASPASKRASVDCPTPARRASSAWVKDFLRRACATSLPRSPSEVTLCLIWYKLDYISYITPNKAFKFNTSMSYMAFYVKNAHFYATYGISYSLKCEYKSNPKRTNAQRLPASLGSARRPGSR